MSEIFDNVMESTTTEGTGDLTLDGAVTGYQSFATACGGAAEVRVCIRGAAGGAAEGEWETVRGTFIAPDQFVKTEVEDSSDAGSPVNFSAGTKHVYITHTAAMIRRLAVADGTPPELSGGAALAIGVGSSATAADAIAIGPSATANIAGCLALGDNATATGAFGVSGVAIGENAISNAGVAIGENASTGENGVSIGPKSSASAGGSSSVDVGSNASADGSAATAIGYQASAAGNGATAVGPSTQAAGNLSVAVGNGARADAEGAVAIGDASFAALAPGCVSRGRRYALIEDAVFLGATTNAGTASTAMEAQQYGGEMEPVNAFGLLYGYVYARGTGASAGELKIIRVEAVFTVSTGVVGIEGTPVYTEVHETAGATGWSVAVSGSSGILRVTVSNDSTDTQDWKAKLWVESF